MNYLPFEKLTAYKHNSNTIISNNTMMTTANACIPAEDKKQLDILRDDLSSILFRLTDLNLEINAKLNKIYPFHEKIENLPPSPLKEPSSAKTFALADCFEITGQLRHQLDLTVINANHLNSII